MTATPPETRESLPFRLIGLTGGIASGKSTVSAHLAQYGLDIVDADKLARVVVEPGTAGLARVVEAFGQEVLLDNGALDRKRLGSIIFDEPEARKRLSSILHPLIAAEFVAQTRFIQEQGSVVAIYDAPLLVENGIHKGLDLLVVVAVDEKIQIRRLMERDQLSLKEARERIRSQLPLEDKIAVANVVINNDGPIEQTLAQVDDLVRTMPGLLWSDPHQPKASTWLQQRLRAFRHLALKPLVSTPTPSPSPKDR